MKNPLPPLVCAVLLTAFLFGAGCGPQQVEPGDAGAVPNHPRMILTDALLARLKLNIEGPAAESFQALRRQVDEAIDNPRSDTIHVRQQGRLARRCGLLWLLTEDRRYLDAGAGFLEAALVRYVEVEGEKGGGDWEAVEFRRYCCHAWDWLYSGLTDEQRARFGEKILDAGRLAWDRKWFTPYGGGGYATLDPVFWPAAALHESGIADSTAAEWFAWVREHIPEWRKMQEQVAADDGGMYSGLAYAAYNYLRTPIFIFETWKTITGEDLTEDNPYLEHFGVWWAYCVKPNGEWPRIDDTGSVRGGIQPWHFKYLAARYRDGVSLWCLRQQQPARELTAWDVIWDPAGLDVQPTGPDSTWPRARHFEGIGWVVLRSGWEEDDTYSVFDCGDFYYGHQHPAENAFTIFRGGSLAINSGRYEWGSDHRPNYMVRTIASNTVLVYDPDELFVAGGDTLTTDGGQEWPRAQPDEYTEMPGTQFDTGEILAFETNGSYSYVCGDATASYSDHKIERFYRQYVHLLPDVFVVFDRVVSDLAEFRKYWLLHTVNEPVPAGGWLMAPERRGRLYARTVLPEDARVEKIGGEGKEFWVFGENYPPAMTHYNEREGEQWGAWRIQASAADARKEVQFLNVIYAGIEDDDDPPEVEPLVSANGRPGVEISRGDRVWHVLFDSAEQPGGDIVLMDGGRNVLMEKRLTSVVQPQSGIGN